MIACSNVRRDSDCQPALKPEPQGNHQGHNHRRRCETPLVYRPTFLPTIPPARLQRRRQIDPFGQEHVESDFVDVVGGRIIHCGKVGSRKWAILFKIEFIRYHTVEDELSMKPIHPGKILKRELQARELSANQLALALRVPSGRITSLLNGKRSVTPETALRLARYFGNTAQFWLNLQTRYDLATTEAKIGERIKAEVLEAS